jgi:hypothetical protein
MKESNNQPEEKRLAGKQRLLWYLSFSTERPSMHGYVNSNRKP